MNLWYECGVLSRFSRVWLFATPWTVPARLLCLWNSPGKNNGVSCHSLLQEISQTQGSNSGICTAGRFFTICAIKKVHIPWLPLFCTSCLFFWLCPVQNRACQRSDQIRSVAQSCLTLCDPMNRSTPGLPVHHQLLEFTETHVHQVSDAIQLSHPLSSPFPLAPNPSQPQSLFQWVNPSHEVAKVLESQL